MEKLTIICLTILAVLTMPTVIGTFMCIYYIYKINSDYNNYYEEDEGAAQDG